MSLTGWAAATGAVAIAIIRPATKIARQQAVNSGRHRTEVVVMIVIMVVTVVIVTTLVRVHQLLPILEQVSIVVMQTDEGM
jgi:hypothetical protein